MSTDAARRFLSAAATISARMVAAAPTVCAAQAGPRRPTLRMRVDRAGGQPDIPSARKGILQRAFLVTVI